MTNFTLEDLVALADKYPASPKICASEALIEQFRQPKTKKRRIRKKWAKRPENWRPMRGGYLLKSANVLYVHPDTLEAITEQLDRENRRIASIDPRILNMF